jgi:hypothetical protein
MDIRLRGPDLSLEQEHSTASGNFRIEDGFVDANGWGAILLGYFPGSLASLS